MAGYDFSGWFVMLLGMGTVFVGLLGLIYVTRLMSFLCALKKTAPEESAAPGNVEPAPPREAYVPNRPAFVAAVSAAIAEFMGTDPNGLRIHSIKRMDGTDESRGALVAAVSAAIATDMGTQISGIRIHSLKKV